jgi:3-deoxy-7-phosphoheptulonate synthase
MKSNNLWSTIARALDGEYKPRQIITVENFSVGGGRTLIIAGPCSIRDEDSYRSNIEKVLAAGADIIRGGAFKPRTNPVSFQGLGKQALEIVTKVKKDYNVGYACEVTGEFRYPVDANVLPLSPDKARELERNRFSVIDHVCDVANLPWIGSRNCQSYDLIQSLAIKAIVLNKPIMLKRGYWMTIDEYCLALEYVARLGCQVIACLRGVGVADGYRYRPDISDIYILKERLTIPVVVDPSHMAGDYRYVEQLSRDAIFAGADGLIIETSEDRDVELSDQGQAITPDVLKNIIEFARNFEKSRIGGV